MSRNAVSMLGRALRSGNTIQSSRSEGRRIGTDSKSACRPTSQVRNRDGQRMIRSARNASTSAAPSQRIGIVRGTATSLGYALAGSAFTIGTLAAYSHPTLLAPAEFESFTPHTALQEEIEEHINSHPLTLALRNDPSFLESRPHLKYPHPYRDASLTAGVMQGSGKLEVPPYLWVNPDTNELYTIGFLGADLCGAKPGEVHPGVMATMLDEALARCAFESLPSRICVTANLKTKYIGPVKAGSYVLLRVKTEKTEGRKCWVKGTVEELTEDGREGKVLVEAEALMVQPRSKVFSLLGKALSSAIEGDIPQEKARA